MSKIVNKANIHEEKIEIARDCIEHRAVWMGLIYDEIEKMGIDAEEILRAAIKKCGHIHGKNYKAICENPADPSSFAKVFFHENGKKNFEMQIMHCDSSKVKSEFHYCALVNAWKKLGYDDEKIKKLCDIAMDGDRGIAEEIGLKFELADTISNGCKTCQVNFIK